MIPMRFDNLRKYNDDLENNLDLDVTFSKCALLVMRKGNVLIVHYNGIVILS